MHKPIYPYIEQRYLGIFVASSNVFVNHLAQNQFFIHLVKNWQLQATNVCFGTRDDSFGEFYFRESGKLLKLKLNHVGEASLNCCPSCTSAGSRWGCQAFPEKIYTVITDGGDNIILPNPAPSHSFFLPGFNGVSPFIEFNASNMHVERNQVYKIWYLDDFYPKLEGDNTGRSCADVYAVFWD